MKARVTFLQSLGEHRARPGAASLSGSATASLPYLTRTSYLGRYLGKYDTQHSLVGPLSYPPSLGPKTNLKPGRDLKHHASGAGDVHQRQCHRLET